MPKSTMYNIFNTLVTAAKTTGVANIFLSNRPDVTKEMTEFVVIDLPTEQYRAVKGNDDFIVRTEGVFYIGMKAKSDNTPNIGKQTALVQKFLDLFPITDDRIVATEPTVLLKGSDKSGFQLTTITFHIRTKINSFNH